MLVVGVKWKKYFEIANKCLANEYPIEEFDDRVNVAYGKMTQEEFDIKYEYKLQTIKAMKLYKQMLKI